VVGGNRQNKKRGLITSSTLFIGIGKHHCTIYEQKPTPTDVSVFAFNLGACFNFAEIIEKQE